MDVRMTAGTRPQIQMLGQGRVCMKKPDGGTENELWMGS